VGAIVGTGVAIVFVSRLEFGRRSWAAISRTLRLT
jgi:hypothetical protein